MCTYYMYEYEHILIFFLFIIQFNLYINCLHFFDVSFRFFLWHLLLICLFITVETIILCWVIFRFHHHPLVALPFLELSSSITS
jgi:hypothetical protein